MTSKDWDPESFSREVKIPKSEFELLKQHVTEALNDADLEDADLDQPDTDKWKKVFDQMLPALRQ